MNPNVQSLIHTPADMMTDYVNWYEGVLANPGVSFGVPGLDDVLTPMRPGNFIPILARSSHLKTTTAAILAKAEANRIKQRNAQDREIVMFVTWEQSAEEITNLLLADGDYSATDVAWGRVPLETVQAKAIKGVHTPIWVIGNGIAPQAKDTPRMYPETVFQIIEQVEKDYNRRPTLVIFDYLQLIPVMQGQSRTEQVMEATMRIKEVALRARVPAVAAVQARQEVDDRENKFPTMRDAGWSKAIVDTADKAISIWYPCRTHEPGDLVTVTIDGKNQTFVVDDELVFFRILKQRFAPGFGTFAYRVDPGRLSLQPYGGKHINLDEGV